MSTTASTSLKRCPFCGSPGTYVWDDIEEVWIAGCSNDSCIVSANTTMYQAGAYAGFTDRIEGATRLWNRRAK